LIVHTPSSGNFGKGSKAFFFEKKKQKIFVALAQSLRPLRGNQTKVFWFFFSKKNTFFLPRTTRCKPQHA
jgi:hypothetical protein